MELKLNQRVEQTASPQMIQTMNILQMSMQELLEYLREAIQENPVLEQDDNFRENDWSTLRSSPSYDPDSEEEDASSRYGAAPETGNSLYEFLKDQLERKHLRQELYWAALFLAAGLNESGWLEESLQELSANSGLSMSLLEEALVEIQTLEPSGIGARNLRECLTLQLRHCQDAEAVLARRIVDGHLDALAKYRYGQIAKQLDCTQEEVQAAVRCIRQLNPRPGADFTVAERTAYLTPDLILHCHGWDMELVSNEALFPSLKISDYYTALVHSEQQNPEVRDYLSERITQAKWLMKAVEQRRSTMMACARCILTIQREFFFKGPGYLVPLTMSEVADRIGVHESTVSRTLKNKYLQCSMGVYPLTYFFQSAVGTTEQTSADRAKCLMKKLIEEEDGSHPLSDQKLCQRMEEEGCEISRRTVAKYREELGIPNASGRKQL